MRAGGFHLLQHILRTTLDPRLCLRSPIRVNLQGVKEVLRGERRGGMGAAGVFRGGVRLAVMERLSTATAAYPDRCDRINFHPENIGWGFLGQISHAELLPRPLVGLSCKCAHRCDKNCAANQQLVHGKKGAVPKTPHAPQLSTVTTRLRLLGLSTGANRCGQEQYGCLPMAFHGPFVLLAGSQK